MHSDAVPAERAPGARRYLALDQILPGDVVLSSARTVRSWFIRLGTGSLSASHAAIAIHPLLWFEAVGTGVRFQVIEPELVWDGQGLRLAMRIPPGEKYHVRRRVSPLFDPSSAMARHQTARRLIDSASRYAFLNYARPSEFLATLRLGLGDSALARLAAGAMDRDRTVLYPGPFCSWLVAECYRDLGATIPGIAPKAITPAALARSKALRHVDAAVVGVAAEHTTQVADFARELKLPVALAAASLNQTSSGALLAKAATSLNEGVRSVVSRGWHLSGQTLPKQAIDSLDRIKVQQLKSFDEWQAKSKQALELAYPNLSVHSEQVGVLSACYRGCADAAEGRSPCAQGCHRVVQAFFKSMDEIYAAFPRPATDLE